MNERIKECVKKLVVAYNSLVIGEERVELGYVLVEVTQGIE